MGPGPTTDSPEPLTIKEIARLTGVSIGTVDRVLHNRGRVSAENVEKIQSLIADRGYQPNLFASRLSAGAVRTVGVAIPHPEQDFGYWGLIARGMEKAARELQPLRLHIAVERFDRQSPEDLARAFQTLAGADALAVAPIHVNALRPLVDALSEVPLVFFDTDMECSRTRCFVGQDPWPGGAVAARLLGLAAGAGTPLGVVRFDEDDEHLQLRSQAFAEAAQQAGAPVHTLAQTLSAPLISRLAEARSFLREHGIGGLFVPNASVGEYAAAEPEALAGYDLTPDNQAALGDGRVAFILSQRPEVMGYETVLRLGRALLFREPLPRSIPMPLDIVFQENLAGHRHGA